MTQNGDNEVPYEATSEARSGSSVARNTLWNILGTCLPLLLALVAFPILISSIGKERFGVLAIAWVILGYFGLFDLGLGRATTRFLAGSFAREHVIEARALFWTSLSLNLILGLIGGIVFAVLSPLLVVKVLSISRALQPESLNAFYLMALTVPLVNLTTAVRGVLEARHRFGLLNAIQIPTSALTYLAPLLVLPFSISLTWLIGALAVSRLLGIVAFLIAALGCLENPFAGPFFARKKLRELFSYGGWLTVSNVIGPLMVYADRFVIGSLSSMTAVTYYSTPYEAVTRLWALPQSLSRTVFPIFADDTASHHDARIYKNAIKYLALILAPIVTTIIVFAPDLLRLWVGEAFARNSTLVLQILAAGVLVNSLALIPFTYIQGVGRPDVTAKFHLVEAPFYLLLLWFGVQHFGIVGSAAAWTIRVSVDGFLLALYVRLSGELVVSDDDIHLSRSLIVISLFIVSGCLISALTGSTSIKIFVWVLLLVGSTYGTWRGLLMQHERRGLYRIAGRTLNRTVRIFSKNYWQGKS